jgi:hypothetical protein
LLRWAAFLLSLSPDPVGLDETRRTGRVARDGRIAALDDEVVSGRESLRYESDKLAFFPIDSSAAGT